MNKVMTIRQAPAEALKDYLKYLLDNDHVSGVLCLAKTCNNNILNYAFITDSANIEAADPLAPVMPENGGTILSSLTPGRKMIAAVLHPCEQRAFIERVKREQGSLENVILISSTCGGVYPLKTLIQEDQTQLVSNYAKDLETKQITAALRPTCKACEQFIPHNSDVVISRVGEKSRNNESKFYLNSEIAVKISKGFSEDVQPGGLDKSLLDDYLQLRRKAREELFAATVCNQDGLTELVDIFGKCVGCHGCSRACPICYCVLCDFESAVFDYDGAVFKKDLNRKGALRLPPDTLFFQLGRLSHMSFSCVGCGQCTDVCPADIPVAAIFSKTGAQTAALFDYVPGRNVKDDIPVMVFKEEEFPELGE